MVQFDFWCFSNFSFFPQKKIARTKKIGFEIEVELRLGDPSGLTSRLVGQEARFHFTLKGARAQTMF